MSPAPLVWLSMLVVAIALGVTAPAVQAQDVLQLQAPAHGIAAIRASLDGHDGLFMFDSGIGVSAVTPPTASELGCHPWGKVTGFRAIGERIDLPRCGGARIEVGDLRLQVPQLMVIDLARLMGPPGDGFGGILGLDLFADRTVTLDVAGNRVIVETRQSAARIARTAIEVPIRLVRAAEGAALTVDLGIPTAPGLLWMEIDTGNYGPSLIDLRAAPLLGLDAGNKQRQDWHGAVAKGVTIDGPAVVRDLILDGDLGRDVLAHWLVTLDLSAGRGWIRQVR